MEKIIKWIADLAPFLAPYPGFVKLLFVAWVGLGAALFVSLILARPAGTPVTAQPKDKMAETGTAKKEAWMVIEGLEFFAARPGAQVRVVANVNGTEFIYPSRGGVEWLEVGPSMSAQIFRLPPARERYIVRFEATVRVPAAHGEAKTTGRLTSVKDDIVDVADGIPFSGRYILHTFDPVHMARSADANAELLYRITYDPK